MEIDHSCPHLCVGRECSMHMPVQGHRCVHACLSYNQLQVPFFQALSSFISQQCSHTDLEMGTQSNAGRPVSLFRSPQSSIISMHFCA